MKRRTFIRNSAAAAAGVSLLNTGFISRRAAMVIMGILPKKSG